MIVSNDMTHDSRVDRHARTLASIGHEVTVLSRASSREQSRHERAAGYTIVRYFESLISPRVLVQKESGPASPPRHWPLGAKTLAKCLNVTKHLSLLFAQRLWLYVMALRIRADICHCNDLDTLDIGALMKIAGKKVVYDSHELYVEQIPPSALKALVTVSERLFLKLTDVVITVNPFIAASLRHTYQIKKPVRVVLNCPENTNLPPARFRHPSDPVVVLYHGGLYPERGLENLVLASKHFDGRVRLLMRGHGELEPKLKALASGSDKVAFEKSVPMDQVVQAAANADIGIIPYLATNLNNVYCSPNKLFDYIQAGLAIVASDLPFLRQVIAGNDIGTVFNPEDPHDIARVVNFAAEPERLTRFKQHVQAIRYRYSWEFEREQLLRAYEDLQSS